MCVLHAVFSAKLIMKLGEAGKLNHADVLKDHTLTTETLRLIR